MEIHRWIVHSLHANSLELLHALKTNGRQFDNFFVICGALSCRNDNLRCHQWWQSCQIDGCLFFSAVMFLHRMYLELVSQTTYDMEIFFMWWQHHVIVVIIIQFSIYCMIGRRTSLHAKTAHPVTVINHKDHIDNKYTKNICQRGIISFHNFPV